MALDMALCVYDGVILRVDRVFFLAILENSNLKGQKNRIEFRIECKSGAKWSGVERSRVE